MKSPNLLVVTSDYRSIPIPEVLQSLEDHSGATVASLNRRQVQRLWWTLRSLKAQRYQHVMIDLPFKHIYKKIRTLEPLPGLIFYEEDACQDALPGSRWQKAFSDFYQRTQPEKVIVTGHITACRLRKRGVKAYSVPKGFSSTNTGLMGLERDIPLAFIGRIRSNVYSERAELLEQAHRKLGCQLLRTEGPENYRKTLNRIQFFLSADIGLDEYMAKNFEAMACGCILVAYEQGRGEEEMLGLKDMENCILYKNLDQAGQKIEKLMSTPSLLAALQSRSLTLSKSFSHYSIGKKIAALL